MTKTGVLLLKYAGQDCDVTLTKRGDGSVYATFMSSQHLPPPAMEERDVKRLLNKMAALRAAPDVPDNPCLTAEGREPAASTAPSPSDE